MKVSYIFEISVMFKEKWKKLALLVAFAYAKWNPVGSLSKFHVPASIYRYL